RDVKDHAAADPGPPRGPARRLDGVLVRIHRVHADPGELLRELDARHTPPAAETGHAATGAKPDRHVRNELLDRRLTHASAPLTVYSGRSFAAPRTAPVTGGQRLQNVCHGLPA